MLTSVYVTGEESKLMRRVYKYRLYPNKTQEKMLGRMLQAGRFAYNQMYFLRQEIYQRDKRSASRGELMQHVATMRNEGHELLQALPADCFGFLAKRLDEAYKHFFRRIKEGADKPGFPKPKNRRTFRSFIVRRSNGRLHSTEGNWAKLYVGYRDYSVGDIRLRFDRELPDGAVIKQISIKEDLKGKWWAGVFIEFPYAMPYHEGDAIGIDVGLASLVTLSDGTLEGNPRWLRTTLTKVRVLQRKIDRQRRANNPDCYDDKGRAIEGARPSNKSTRQKQAEDRLRKLQSLVATQRKLYYNTLSRRLVEAYGVIVLEDLPLDFMLRNKHIALSASDAGIGEFRRMLEYKAEETGAQIIYVPAAYTSQTCSQCGCVSKYNRQTQASFVCTDCGHEENADVNAAKVILARGLAQLEQEAA